MSVISQNYAYAKEVYSQLGVDTDKAIEKLDQIPLSIHCWQGDDVIGFENFDGGLTGGIQTTGNYPGKATNPQQLRADIDKAFQYIPGAKKLNIHASYVDTSKKVDRNAIEPEHFSSWADWAVEKKIGLDFNPTYFSHPLSADGYTLSHPDQSVREFWIEHGIRSRKIGAYFGKRTGQPCLNNIWIPDGEKEVPIGAMDYRRRLKDSLDEILKETIDPKYNLDSVESKLFGIGSEAFVVGSHEFYMGYAAKRDDILVTLDTGHFHPTELVSNKISAMLLFHKGLLLHVSRPVRWDSDHVVTLNDEVRDVMKEIVRGDALGRVYLSLDYFDASINRIMAWVVGSRNAKKALLEALLEPTSLLRKAEQEGDKGTRLALLEELKTMPSNLVWEYYCESKGIVPNRFWIEEVKQYEADVLRKR